ncbi:smg-9, nonsense mediated mRNA decay factor [Entomortierella chlamydospora]|nr:smg-9, nonsense mediated mRNA decay factor [Entomortierella chlamydospora]
MMSVAGFQTSGIDMHITPERMILLDTEPIFCLSNLENALRNERITDGVPLDVWLDHQALTMATFLISVCNVVLVMTGERESGSDRIFKLLQRVEVFMKALSASSSNSSNAPIQGAGTSASSTGQSGLGQDGVQREGLGDWCADIGIYPRFEDCFNTVSSDAANSSNSVASSLRKKRLSALSVSAESLSSDAEVSQEKETTSVPTEQIQPQQQDILNDERKSAPYFNFVILPFDSIIASGTSSTTNPSTAGPVAAKPSALSSNSSLQSAMSNLSVTINRYDILGASLRRPYHDVFGTVVQDQERWGVWAKGLRNKILSLSMRPQGGPALGPRNRPGIVSEREWLRYASRSWDSIRKADFLAEYVRASKLSREG